MFSGSSRVSWLKSEKKQRFKGLICPRLQGTDVYEESALETLVFRLLTI
jgi:hypothetical protein